MFDDNYIIESKGIPLVSYYRELKNIKAPFIFTQMHYHSDFEILYIVKGQAKMQINGNTIFADADSLLLINPYETHYGEILSEDFSYFCIDFNIKLLSLPYEEKLLKEELKYINHLDGKNFKDLIINICNAYENEPSGWKLFALGNCMIMFSHLEDKLVSALPSKENVFTKKVIDYLNENYSKNISSKTISDALCYNQSYFCRTFKKYFSLKFCDYLNIYRIKIAKELLKTENVSNAALLSGFSNTSYFSVVFKEHTKMTPMQYKKQIH